MVNPGDRVGPWVVGDVYRVPLPLSSGLPAWARPSPAILGIRRVSDRDQFAVRRDGTSYPILTPRLLAERLAGYDLLKAEWRRVHERGRRLR